MDKRIFKKADQITKELQKIFSDHYFEISVIEKTMRISIDKNPIRAKVASISEYCFKISKWRGEIYLDIYLNGKYCSSMTLKSYKSKKLISKLIALRLTT